jgi:hypothetical protein
MIWLLIFFGLILSILSYLLFAPFYIEINTQNGLCGIRFHKLLTAKLKVTQSSLLLDLKIAGIQKQIDLLTQKNTSKQATKKKVENTSYKKILAILVSFKVNKFYLTICFDNMSLNGILYPFFRWLSFKTEKVIEINFCGQNEIAFEAENNFFRVIRAYIKS